MQHPGSTVKAALAALLLAGVLVACGGDDGPSAIVAPSPPPSTGPGSPPPTGPGSPPPDDGLDPEIIFFQLPSTEIMRGDTLILPEGFLVTNTPRGLQAGQNAFRIEIRALSEGNAFFTDSFFSAVQAGCSAGDVVCSAQGLPIGIGSNAELDDYVIEVTVFDSINVSTTASQTFTIVEPGN